MVIPLATPSVAPGKFPHMVLTSFPSLRRNGETSAEKRLEEERREGTKSM